MAQNPFSLHYQVWWRERSSEQLPLYLRVFFLALGSHRANRHANFIGPKNSLAYLLGRHGEDGKVIPERASRISEAIRKAKDLGFLAEESNNRCLVIPHHAVRQGLGKEYEPCAVHDGRRTGRK